MSWLAESPEPRRYPPTRRAQVSGSYSTDSVMRKGRESRHTILRVLHFASSWSTRPTSVSESSVWSGVSPPSLLLRKRENALRVFALFLFAPPTWSRLRSSAMDAGIPCASIIDMRTWFSSSTPYVASTTGTTTSATCSAARTSSTSPPTGATTYVSRAFSDGYVTVTGPPSTGSASSSAPSPCSDRPSSARRIPSVPTPGSGDRGSSTTTLGGPPDVPARFACAAAARFRVRVFLAAFFLFALWSAIDGSVDRIDVRGPDPGFLFDFSRFSCDLVRCEDLNGFGTCFSVGLCLLDIPFYSVLCV